VKPFVSLAAKQDRSFFNDARHRATLFDSGIISSMLDILSVAHKLPAIDATFTGAAESLPVRDECCCILLLFARWAHGFVEPIRQTHVCHNDICRFWRREGRC
jgi:hypothetical protein